MRRIWASLPGTTGITWVSEVSIRGCARSKPIADPTPAPNGMITRGAPIERARRAACTGPAPPKATMA